MNDNFEYSKEWYSNVYHAQNQYRLPEREYTELMEEWAAVGYKERLYGVLNASEQFIDFNNGKTACEIGCHHGKSIFWMCERYSHISYNAFGFLPVAIEWCKKW